MTFPLPATAFALPLAAPFRGLTRREGMLIEGPGGWGEFSPFADYDPDRSARWLLAAVEAALDPDPGPGGPVRSNAILPDVADDEQDQAVAALLTDTGCDTLKIKIGGRDTAAEIRRIAAIHAAATGVRPDVRLRLDANGLLGTGDARELFAALSWLDIGLEYVEQPCQTVADLRRLRLEFPDVPVAADEALRRDREFDAVAEFADVAVVKIAPWGGIAAARDIVAGLGVPAVISGAAESSVGLARDAVAAARLGDPARAHGLGTGTLLADDVTAMTVSPVDGVVPATRRRPDPGALQRAQERLDPVERAHWADRLDTAWEALRPVAPADLLARLGVSA
ncbi:MAG: enolase C-terminal domain-like protein [Candidatus Nanopelagicales bacterium]